ncbi:hypothetical protein NEISUBOT_03001 [Neisseria subflava NJ9703]|uniref:Uncharacterized protein n=1 Tax=Neisseria subflava NJ9703 TaxID=546268 RepID=A0A9W5ISQ9_NEISU|nr:hypothetical protein NEISUBOT_03001 [Neisseria subflava NJ9703]
MGNDVPFFVSLFLNQSLFVSFFQCIRNPCPNFICVWFRKSTLPIKCYFFGLNGHAR